jgi:hypothetical protein
MTKPLTGGNFKLFRDRIVSLSGKHCRIKQQERVGRKVSASNEHESNQSTMKRDAIKKKAGARKKSVVTAKECIPKNENMKESVPSWAVSIHDSFKNTEFGTSTTSAHLVLQTLHVDVFSLLVASEPLCSDSLQKPGGTVCVHQQITGGDRNTIMQV